MWRYIFNLPHDHMLKGYKNLWVKASHSNHHFTVRGSHWPSASVDVKYLICHVTPQENVTEGSSVAMGGSPSW